MLDLAQALQGRDYVEAQAVQHEIHTKKTDECGSWMVSFLPILLSHPRDICLGRQYADFAPSYVGRCQ